MNYRFLRISGSLIWGKHTMSRDYFINAVKAGDVLIDLENMTQFDSKDNEWKPIEGDRPDYL